MANPYTAPDAALDGMTSGDNDTYEPKVFSTQGRIGRLRYLAYGTCVNIVLLMIFGILFAILVPMLAHGKSSGVIGAAVLLMYIPIFANMFIMAKRRLNDLDQSGWLSLLMIVPLVNFFFGLYLIFAGGTQGANRYGPMPTKNSGMVIFGALLIPIFVFLIGIAAAIALPAYQSYVTRAKAAQAARMQQAPAPAQFDQGQ